MGFLKSIIAKVGMDTSDFELGGKRVINVSEHMADHVAGHFKEALAGAFGAAALEEGIRGIVEYAAQIKDMAEQTGLTTDEVQRLGYAAKETGLQFEDFQTALGKMGAARKDAAEKNDALLTQFERYGVTLDDLQNPALRNVDLLYKMSAAIRDVELSAGDRESLREFFGKSGDKLAESISKIDQVKDRPIISAQDIEAIDKMEKAVERLWTTMKVAGAGLVGSGADTLTAMLGEGSLQDRITNFISTVFNPADWTIGTMFADAIGKKLRGGGPSAENPVATETGQQFGPSQTGKEKLFTNQRDLALIHQRADIQKLLDRNSFVGLDRQKQKDELQFQIHGLLNSADGLNRPKDEKAKNELLKQAAEKNNELQALSRGAGGKPTNVDSLARIGGYVGGAENVMADLARRNLAANHQTAANTARIAALLGNTRGGDIKKK